MSECLAQNNNNNLTRKFLRHKYSNYNRMYAICAVVKEKVFNGLAKFKKMSTWYHDVKIY